MTPRQIHQSFGNRLIGTKRMKSFVEQALSKMPDEIVEFVTSKCWFMASMEDAYAFTFTGNDLKDNHLIFLSDDLLNQEKKQIFYTIYHEIGHVILGHRNSVFVKQSKEEISNQEREADEFALKYL